jgi:neutral ceramidase
MRLGAALMAMALAVSGTGEAVAGDLMAGVAQVDLTPPLSMKATLGGYGERANKPAVGIHDRILAKALVLSEGDKRFVLVTADTLAFPSAVKQAVLAKLADAGWKGDQIMLLPSHSHAAIEMNSINPMNLLKIPQIGLFQKELYDLTVANLVKVITDANRDLVPVTVGTASTTLQGWNRNRRKDSRAIDPELTVTRIDKAGGEPFAVLVNWTAHPTLMDAEDMMFSGGWPGHLQRTLTALIGGGVTAMYYNGAQGDQSPVPREAPVPSASTAPARMSNWERAERYGRELAIIAWRVWEKTRPSQSPVLAYRLEEVALPQAAVHPDFMKTGGTEYGLTPEIMTPILGTMFPKKTNIGYLRLGDLLIVGIPGEAAVELGLQIKQKVRQETGIPHAVIGGLANEWVSYILSPEEYDKGGYESSVSFYGRTLGPTIVDAAIRGAAGLAR